MNDRLDKLGIKQVIRYEWMEYTLQLLLSGMTPDQIREELEVYLEDKKQSGGIGDRGSKTYSMAISILMKSWVTPVEELINLRDACLKETYTFNDRTVMHWVMISTAYPFWQNVASVFGKLFTFQEVVSRKQVVKRLKEIYGDRQTVSRNARYVIRSMIAWNIIDFADQHGFYRKDRKIQIENAELISLLYESILLNTREFRLPYEKITSSDSLFPFQFPPPAQNIVASVNSRIKLLANGYSGSVLAVEK